MTALPPELAPSLRAAAERLLAECKPALHREHSTDQQRHEQERKRCWSCHEPGPLVMHRRPDGGGVVEVHAGCRRRLLQGRDNRADPR